MKLRSTFSLMVAAACSTSLAAQTTQAPTSQPPKKALDPNEVVCEKQEVLGSRLATQKICHTRAEWAELRRNDRQEIERVQVQRGCNDRC
jgi:invasion protein IalB